MSKARLLMALAYALSLGQSWAQDQSPTRQQIYEALRAERILNPDRMLVHYSHTCNLDIEGKLYPVVDLQELVKGGVSPRGVNRIVVLSPTLAFVKEFDYTRQRPLFCQQNRLYVYGDLTLKNTLPEGNVLSFVDGAKTVKLSHVEATDYPIPITRLRKQPPQ
jgi:hypothetical protein